jgi:hypothetical protein
METKVLSQEEIQSLKNFRLLRISTLEQLGAYELTSIEIEQQKLKTKEDFLKLLKEEEEFSNKLQQKYGNGTIDIDKGEFISSI